MAPVHINGKRGRLHVYQHGAQAQQRGSFQRGHVGEGRHDNLGPGGQLQAHQGQGQGVGPVGAGHHVGAAQVGAQLSRKCPYGRPLNEGSLSHYCPHGVIQSGLQGGVFGGQIKQLNRGGWSRKNRHGNG